MNARLRSFVDVAPTSHFPIQNLPYGVFSPRDGGDCRGIETAGEEDDGGPLRFGWIQSGHDEVRRPHMDCACFVGTFAV